MPDYHSYNTASEHGLSHNPFKALISPRPIAWISSLFDDGAVNLAPYSFFNAFSENPPLIGFSSAGRKHSLINIERSGEFVHNLVSSEQIKQMNATSAALPKGASEADEAEIELIASDLVAPPRVAGAPASMECKLADIIHLKGADQKPSANYLVVGEVVRVHIDKGMIRDGMVDQEALGLIARLGYLDYAQVKDVFGMPRP